MVWGEGGRVRSFRRDRLPNACAVAGAVAGGAHLVVAPAHFHHGALVGLTFVAFGLLQLAVAAASASASPRVLKASALVSVAAIDAYVVSRTHGLPGLHREAWDMFGAVTCLFELVCAATAVLAVQRTIARRSVTIGLAASLLMPAAVMATPVPPNAAPTHCMVANRQLTLYAQELAPGPDGKHRLAFGTTRSNGSIPGPLIELMEGDCLAVTLVNDVSAETLRAIRDDGRWPSDPSLPLGVSLHPHGVRYTQYSDGTVHTGSFAPPGQALTYLWYAAPRVAAGNRVVSPGSAGYWWYHDHVVGTDHGTGGVASGLFGGLIVRRPSDVIPDRTYVVGMGGPAPLLNYRSYPQSFACDETANRPGPACFVAVEGQRVEFLVIGVPGTLAREDLHVFHLHAHTWADNRTGLLTADDDVRVIDAKSVAPSESFGFQVIAGDESGPGDWMLHCHIQEHSDRGMMTFFRVLPRRQLGEDLPPTTVPSAQGHVHAPSGRP